MRGQIPIIIAIIILFGLIVSTLIFTSTLAITVQSNQQVKYNTYWEIISNDLDTLDLVALKHASIDAFNVFQTNYNSKYYGGTNVFTSSLKLISRSAIFWTNFSTDPISTGKLIPISGFWRTITTQNYLELELTRSSTSNTGYEGIALLNFTYPSSAHDIYVVSVFELPNKRPAWYADMIVNISNLSFYTLGLEAASYNLTAYEYNGTWYKLASNTTNLQGTTGIEMTSILDYKKNIPAFNLSLYDPLLDQWYWLYLSNVLKQSYKYLGIGGFYNSTKQAYVYYYYLVISIDRDPRYIYITNLQPGWSVTIYNYNNPYFSTYSGYANSTGIAKIEIPSCILYDSQIYIEDEYGNVVLNTTLPIIVGGDIYEYVKGVQIIPSTPAPYNYTLALQRFKEALYNASLAAQNVLGQEALSVIYNWIDWMKKEGYLVTVSDFTPIYNVSIYNIGYTSYGEGTVGFGIIYNIYSPSGEFMSFKKSIYAHYRMIFDQGYPYGTKYMTIPITINTYLEINGKKYYYMVSRDQLKINIMSELFSWLPSFSYYTNNSVYYSVNPVSAAYYGGGLVNATYKLQYGYSGTIAATDLFYDIVDILVPEFGNYQTFLWAVTSSVNLDGIIVPSALKIVFIYNYQVIGKTQVLQVRLYGSANRPITPLT